MIDLVPIKLVDNVLLWNFVYVSRIYQSIDLKQILELFYVL